MGEGDLKLTSLVASGPVYKPQNAHTIEESR